MDNPQVSEHIALMKDKDVYIRYRATTALGQIGDASAVPALIETLKDKDYSVRCLAATALGEIGDASAVPALIEALKDTHDSVRRNADSALGQIGDSSAVPALIMALKDKDDFVRKRAAEVLGKIGDVSAVSALIGVLKDKDYFVRESVASALVKIGDASAVPTLIEMLRDMDGSVRRRAAEVLGKIGDSDTLPRKILAHSRWLAPERINVLERLRHVRYNDNHITLRYTFPETRELCQSVLTEEDATTREGAQAVLNWLDGANLLRGSQPDTTNQFQVLVRAAQGSTSETQSETLLIAADEPDREEVRAAMCATFLKRYTPVKIAAHATAVQKAISRPMNSGSGWRDPGKRDK